MTLRRLAIVALLAPLAGCSLPPEEPMFGSISPVETTMAIEQAAQTRDLTKVDELVVQLESCDPAIRLVAIAALRDMTGQDLGYNPGDCEADRLAAIERWHAWVVEQRAAGKLPPDPPSQPPSGAKTERSA